MIRRISSNLQNWYEENKRDLPWRNTNDPYLIWISEVILQQTRIDQGLPYYHRFIDRFPRLQSLAAANEDEVLREWQGLGYYSRARNLHQAAITIVNDHGGKIPQNYNGLLQMKGIGDYTASAIASFAFGEAKAAVDGNVIRFLSRLFGIEIPVNRPEGIAQIRKIADEILDQKKPGLHNQAIMEFGALQCIPSKPDCVACIFNDRCMAYLLGKVSSIPHKEKPVARKLRHLNYFVVENSGQILIRKRMGNDIWKGLYELPLIEKKLVNASAIFNSRDWKELFPEMQFSLHSISEPIKHILTHRVLISRFFELKVSNAEFKILKKRFEYVGRKNTGSIAFPSLLSKYFNNNFN